MKQKEKQNPAYALALLAFMLCKAGDAAGIADAGTGAFAIYLSALIIIICGAIALDRSAG